jgi:membrane carboxypeptidase/penicillin-binding protein
MSKVLTGTPIETFPVPRGIVFVKVDPQTGVPSSAKNALYESFLEGTSPTGAAVMSPGDVQPDTIPREVEGED